MGVIVAWVLVGIIFLLSALQVRNIIGMLMYMLMKYFGWFKRAFLPMKTTKAMSNMLETLINTIETDKSVKVSLRKRILVIEQNECDTIYILVDPRSAFYGCCVDKKCSSLVFQELPNRRSIKKLKKLVDSLFGTFIESPATSITPKRF